MLVGKAVEDDQKIKLHCYHFLGDKIFFEGGEINEDPSPRRSQRIVQAHELESEAQILACDMEYEDQEAADVDHKAHEMP